jgi:hypothetical protein
VTALVLLIGHRRKVYDGSKRGVGGGIRFAEKRNTNSEKVVDFTS